MAEKTKKIAMTAAGLSLGVALVAGASGFGDFTGATWSDSAQVNGVTVTNGNLDIEPDTDRSGLYDISADFNSVAKKITASDFHMVPGDTLQYRAGFKVALEGDNLVADLVLNNPNATGDALADTHGVTVKYAIYKADAEGNPTGSALAESEFSATQPSSTIKQVDLKPTTDGVVKDIQSETKANYVVVTTLKFDKDTPNRDHVQEATLLSNIEAQLVQQSRTGASL